VKIPSKADSFFTVQVHIPNFLLTYWQIN